MTSNQGVTGSTPVWGAITMKSYLFTLGCNDSLTKEVSGILNIEISKSEIIRFADGEAFAKTNTDVNGCDCYIIHSLASPVNDNLMDLLIFIDGLKRGGANKIVVVIPYVGYSRQDRAFKKGDPISGLLIHNLLEAVNVDEICCIDFHSPDLFAQYKIKKTNLSAAPILANYIKNNVDLLDICVVSPDFGGINRANEFASYFNGCPVVYAKKTRPSVNTVIIEQLCGDVKNKQCIIYDDMIDTGGTLIEIAKCLKENGAKKIIFAGTHGVFSSNSIDNLNKSEIEHFYITNSIEGEKIKKLRDCNVISVATLLADFLRDRF